MEFANQLWAILLHGRFRRLQEWCTFTAHSRLPIVTEDTWCQVREELVIFSHTGSAKPACGQSEMTFFR